MRVTLRVLAGPYNGQEFVFDQHDTFLIGRSENAHLYLPEDRFFSRHHCLLEIAPPRCFLRDLGSTNGTFVNGDRVQEVFLKSGDRLQGGQTVLEVEVQAEKQALDAEAPTLTKPIEITIECVNCGRRECVQGSATNEPMTFICEECREELKRQPQPVPGYEMIKMLGRGGMGCVMLARNEQTGGAVAIKTLLPEVAVTDQALRRFMREIDVAAALDHPNIVRYIESGTHNGAVYLVTEYVEGSDAAKTGGFAGRTHAVQRSHRCHHPIAGRAGVRARQGLHPSGHQRVEHSPDRCGAKLHRQVDGLWSREELHKHRHERNHDGRRHGRDFRIHAAGTNQRLPERQTNLGYLRPRHDGV